MNMRIAIVLLLLISCSNRHEQQQVNSPDVKNSEIVSESKNHNADTFLTEKNNTTTSIEDFDTFFSQFNHDSLFQFHRTVIPLKIVTSDIFENHYTEFLDSSKWHFFSLEYDSASYYQHFDSFEQIIEMGKDSVNVGLRGIDNGIYINYVFRSKDGKWYLSMMEDFSN